MKLRWYTILNLLYFKAWLSLCTGNVTCHVARAMCCTWLCTEHLSVHAGNSAQCSQKAVENFRSVPFKSIIIIIITSSSAWEIKLIMHLSPLLHHPLLWKSNCSSMLCHRVALSTMDQDQEVTDHATKSLRMPETTQTKGPYTENCSKLMNTELEIWRSGTMCAPAPIHQHFTQLLRANLISVNILHPAPLDLRWREVDRAWMKDMGC